MEHRQYISGVGKQSKHGTWEGNQRLYEHGMVRCSECMTEYYVHDLLHVGEGMQERLPNYCPHCGADMRK